MPEYIAEQLAHGVLKDGSRSDFVYSPITVEIKKTKSGLSSVTSHLTNYDTGESYRKLYAKVIYQDSFTSAQSSIKFGTNSGLEDEISARMKNKAFGLTPENKREFIRSHAAAEFIKIMRNELGLQ